MEYNARVRGGKISPLHLAEVRSQIDANLAAQGIEPLDSLEQSVSHPVGGKSAQAVDQELGFLPFEQEMEGLSRLDAKLSMNGGLPADPRHRDVEHDKHYADLTPRELERKTEFENPQSQHNWLKTHTKVLGNEEGDETESLASHDLGGGGGSSTKPAKGRKAAGKGSLAKQVGDRAVEKAREGSQAFSNDEDELASDVGLGGANAGASGKKKARDPDGTYRVKGAKAGAAKGKRKRSGEDMPSGGAGGAGKRAKVEGAGPGTSGSANGTNASTMGMSAE